MTEKEFRIKFSQTVAEDDFPLCDAGSAYCDNLSNDGLTRLTDIAEATAEPLFDEIKDLKEKLQVDEGEFVRLYDKIVKLEKQLAEWAKSRDIMRRSAPGA